MTVQLDAGQVRFKDSSHANLIFQGASNMYDAGGGGVITAGSPDQNAGSIQLFWTGLELWLSGSPLSTELRFEYTPRVDNGRKWNGRAGVLNGVISHSGALAIVSFKVTVHRDGSPTETRDIEGGLYCDRFTGAQNPSSNG